MFHRFVSKCDTKIHNRLDWPFVGLYLAHERRICHLLMSGYGVIWNKIKNRCTVTYRWMKQNDDMIP